MDTPQHSILIVDDDALVRASLRDTLAQLQLQVFEACDGEQGLVRAEELHPDLVFLDLLMPNQSGFETLNQLTRRFPGIRVVVLSSMDVPTLVEQALKQGALQFIVKPFHPVEIREAVHRYLGA